MFVDAVNAETVEHIYRTVPFRVTLGEIVVHSHDVNPVTCQCIKEDGQRRYKCLTFTRSHLGDFTLMQNNTTKELNIVVDHVPRYLIAASNPVVLIESFLSFNGDEVVCGGQFAVEVVSRHLYDFVFSKAARRVLNNSEHLGHNFVECFFVAFENILFEFVDLIENRFAVLNRSFFNLCFELGYLFLDVVRRVLNFFFQFLRLSSKAIIVERLNLSGGGLNLFYKRLNQLHIALALVAE